jgi:hypothetical protein
MDSPQTYKVVSLGFMPSYEHSPPFMRNRFGQLNIEVPLGRVCVSLKLLAFLGHRNSKRNQKGRWVG